MYNIVILNQDLDLLAPVMNTFGNVWSWIVSHYLRKHDLHSKILTKHNDFEYFSTDHWSVTWVLVFVAVIQNQIHIQRQILLRTDYFGGIQRHPQTISDGHSWARIFQSRSYRSVPTIWSQIMVQDKFYQYLYEISRSVNISVPKILVKILLTRCSSRVPLRK